MEQVNWGVPHSTLLPSSSLFVPRLPQCQLAPWQHGTPCRGAEEHGGLWGLQLLGLGSAFITSTSDFPSARGGQQFPGTLLQQDSARSRAIDQRSACCISPVDGLPGQPEALYQEPSATTAHTGSTGPAHSWVSLPHCSPCSSLTL